MIAEEADDARHPDRQRQAAQVQSERSSWSSTLNNSDRPAHDVVVVILQGFTICTIPGCPPKAVKMMVPSIASSGGEAIRSPLYKERHRRRSPA